jgi:hypothetical protein
MRVFTRGYPWYKDNVTHFEEPDLHFDSDWTLEVKTKQLFGGNWFFLYTLAQPLNLDDDCMHRECGDKVAACIMVNY